MQQSIRMLEDSGVDILKSMVKVDPDAIKYQLPEMREYITRNPGPTPTDKYIVAGLATHNESGYLQVCVYVCVFSVCASIVCTDSGAGYA